MCRYAMTSYKPHYACFNCCKTFKRRLLGDIESGKKNENTAKCPQCGSLMANMGLDFESPKKGDSKEWKHIKELYSVGITFHSCGCSGPGYIPKDKNRLILYFTEILEDYNKELVFWRNRVEPINEKEIQRENSKQWERIRKVPSEQKTITNEEGRKYWLGKVNEIQQKLKILKAANK